MAFTNNIKGVSQTREKNLDKNFISWVDDDKHKTAGKFLEEISEEFIKRDYDDSCNVVKWLK